MKIKRFRWNVTILALFILLASALTWVLVALYMKNFIKYSEEISSYEKTSYLAKAGTELGLAIVWSKETWVMYSIDSWYTAWIFECPYPINDEWICPQEPLFWMEIIGLADSYNRCDEEWKKTTVWSGLSIIIPLFHENWLTNNSLSNVVTKSVNYVNRWNVWPDSNLTSLDEWTWKFWVVWSENDMLKMTQWTGPAYKVKDFVAWNHSYLVVANPLTWQTQDICIKWKDIPQETVKIVSVGYYNWRQLWTETFATKALPDFLQGDNYLKNENY